MNTVRFATAARQAVVLCLLALVPALLSAFFHPKRPSWNQEALAKDEVALSTVLQWENVLWLDARSKSSFEKSHVPGALLLNEDAWNELVPHVFESWKPGQKIVVYCDSRECDSSKHVAERLREAGLSPVYVLKGGWESWLAEKK